MTTAPQTRPQRREAPPPSPLRMPRARRWMPGGYRTSAYRRPLITRLTALSWFILALFVLGLTAGAYLLVLRLSARASGDAPLTEWLAQVSPVATPSAAPPELPTVAPTLAVVSPPTPAPATVPAASVPAPLAAPAGTPSVAPPPVATLDPLGAAWQTELAWLPDGTLMAPDAVVAQAMADISDYYALLRNLPLDQYLARRADIYAQHFAGTALEGVLRQEKGRAQYLLNRDGTIEIRIRDFAPNGLSATASISARGWTNDVIDIATGQMIERGRRERDTLTLARIMFERSTGRWKFAIINQVMEVNAP